MSKSRAALELWGGIECTLNRVGKTYYDQLRWSGHRKRIWKDLELCADLGFKTLRTAVHWEYVEASQDWDHADRTLEAMQRLGLRSIVGFLHHGSGPATTSLIDSGFADKFAAFALRVVERYPWLTEFTPINEPQTTGRFGCLYGHWYPHHRAMRSYVRALYHQMKGIVLAMEAIRRIQPKAHLIHTEDGGVTFSAPSLERFCEEREHRRWLGLDLLCGRMMPHHPLFDFLRRNGLEEREILWFAERPCPPAVIGLNYYVTSDRFLDDRLELYPACLAGGDTGFEPLVDTEAVRVHPQGIAGAKTILCQAWERYKLPVAITEAHLGCEPAEQVRWLSEIWQDAKNAQANGAEVRAVTAWGLMGLYNWPHLCTSDTGEYEPGVFDVSNGVPVETPLADVVRQIASGGPIRHAALDSAGWWRQDARLTISPMREPYEEIPDLALPWNGLSDRRQCPAL